MRPKVGVGCIIIKDGKFLLGKRKGAHGEGEWSLPGGHLEFKESFEDCCRRETMEETGLSIKDIRPVYFTNDIFLSENPVLHYVTLFFVAKWEKGNVQLMEPDRCLEWGWFTLGTLPKPMFTPLRNLLKEKPECLEQ